MEKDNIPKSSYRLSRRFSPLFPSRESPRWYQEELEGIRKAFVSVLVQLRGRKVLRVEREDKESFLNWLGNWGQFAQL